MSSPGAHFGDDDDKDQFLPTPRPRNRIEQVGLTQLGVPLDASAFLPTPPLPAAPAIPSACPLPTSAIAGMGSQGNGGKRTGRHKRTLNMGKRLSWKDMAKNHMQRLPSLLMGNHCSANCPGCDVGSFATRRLVEDCAVATFGDAESTRRPSRKHAHAH